LARPKAGNIELQIENLCGAARPVRGAHREESHVTACLPDASQGKSEVDLLCTVAGREVHNGRQKTDRLREVSLIYKHGVTCLPGFHLVNSHRTV
jgi:hypothetical protein